MSRRTSIVVPFVLLFAPPAAMPAAATTYYVSTTGDDGNSGSLGSPWASITHASGAVAPGDTVVVRDGTYQIPAGGLIDGSFGGDWAIASNGSPGKPIVYMAEHRWEAKLVGHGTGPGSTVVGMHGGYNILKNFDITGTNASGVILATSGTTASFNQAVGNYVHDIIVPCDLNGGSGLNTGGGDDYHGISHDDFIGNLVVNITSRECALRTTAGIYEAVPYGLVANNIVINAQYAIQSWHAASHLVIFGNTVLNSMKGIVIGAGDAPGGTNDETLVQNNIAIGNSIAGISEEGKTGANNRYVANLGWRNTRDFSLHNGLECLSCLHADPVFVDDTGTAAGNYCPQRASPTRHAGRALAGIDADYEGIHRPQSGTTVIGACLGAAVR